MTSPTHTDAPLADFRLRDPFVVPLPERGEYLLFGTTADQRESGAVGFDCWVSRDLARWSGPFPAYRPTQPGWLDFWAPEVHHWRGRWYMFATIVAAGRNRGTHILVSEHPRGPYREHSKGAATPPQHICLDGTLHVDERGKPWLVYCHEWIQIGDGTICAMPLDDELRGGIAEPTILFRASQAPWVVEARMDQYQGFVTDGPFLHRAANGDLIMMWSSAGKGGYALAIARSGGGLLGPWFHPPEPIFVNDGGHGMLFRSFAGELLLTLHAPNGGPHERTRIFRARETSGLTLLIGEPYAAPAAAPASHR
jgi:beta-xylosidase